MWKFEPCRLGRRIYSFDLTTMFDCAYLHQVKEDTSTSMFATTCTGPMRLRLRTDADTDVLSFKFVI